MAVVNTVNNIKELFPDYVLLIMIGTFYEVYNDDAKINSYLFKYRIKTLVSNDKVCGFPIVSINKVMFLFENKQINYIMIDKSHNYKEEYKVNYKKKNKYSEILKISDDYDDYIDKANRIENLEIIF